MSKRNNTVGDFLNVDVEVTSRRQLKALAHELKESILYSGRTKNGWFLSFETDSYFGKSTPDGVIAKLCKLIENLSLAARRDWEAARSRVFDIGFESAPNGKQRTVVVRSAVSKNSLARVASVDASLVITCYRHFPEPKTKRLPVKVRTTHSR